MSSPIKDPKDRWGGGLPEDKLGYKEYRYKHPEHKDYKVATIKIILYGCIGAFPVWMLQESANGDLSFILICLLVASAAMVLDALMVLLGEASLAPPTFADFLLPMQSPNWGLIPVTLIYIGSVLGLLYGLGRLIWISVFG